MSYDQVVHFNGRTYMVSVGAKQDILRTLEPFGSESVRWDYVLPSAEKAVPDEEPEPAGAQPEVHPGATLATGTGEPDTQSESGGDKVDDPGEPATSPVGPAPPTESGNPKVEPAIASETPPGAPSGPPTTPDSP